MTGLRLGLVSFLVRDYDEAIAWFSQALGFEVVANERRSAEKRWVVVAPPGGGAHLLLARAATDAQRDSIGAAAGGRVAYFLYTDDFKRDHAAMTAAGVRFLEAPRAEAYGTVAVFEDLYGSKWDLIEQGDGRSGPRGETS